MTTRPSHSQFDLNLCRGSSECDDFAAGLLLGQLTTDANPAYDLQARASNTGIQGEGKFLVIHLSNPDY